MQEYNLAWQRFVHWTDTKFITKMFLFIHKVQLVASLIYSLKQVFVLNSWLHLTELFPSHQMHDHFFLKKLKNNEKQFKVLPIVIHEGGSSRKSQYVTFKQTIDLNWSDIWFDYFKGHRSCKLRQQVAILLDKPGLVSTHWSQKLSKTNYSYYL